MPYTSSTPGNDSKALMLEASSVPSLVYNDSRIINLKGAHDKLT